MMNTNNTYFEEMKRVGCAWEAARKERMERKERILAEERWDELEAWYTEDAAAKFPYESGESKAYRAWQNSIRCQEDELEMDDFLWDKEVADFIKTLRKAGIQSFVYSNQSSAVMENIHAFAAAGCTMDSLCTIKRYESRWGSEEPTDVLGIRFTVN